MYNIKQKNPRIQQTQIVEMFLEDYEEVHNINIPKLKLCFMGIFPTIYDMVNKFSLAHFCIISYKEIKMIELVIDNEDAPYAVLCGFDLMSCKNISEPCFPNLLLT